LVERNASGASPVVHVARRPHAILLTLANPTIRRVGTWFPRFGGEASYIDTHKSPVPAGMTRALSCESVIIEEFGNWIAEASVVPIYEKKLSHKNPLIRV
jgi:hypothetical protein